MDGGPLGASLAGDGLVTNNGTIRTKSGTVGAAYVRVSITNSAAGTVQLDGKTFVGGPGFTKRSITNHGLLLVASDSVVFHDSALTSLPGSTLHAPGRLTLLHSMFTQAGGSLTGNAVVLRDGSTLDDSAGSGSFTLEPGSAPNILKGTVPSGQTVTVLGTAEGDAVASLDDSSIVNNGTLQLDSSAATRAVTITGGTIVNNGTLAVRQGMGGPRRLWVEVSNSGTLDVAATTLINANTRFVNSGLLTLGDDVDLPFSNNGGFTNTASGTLAVTVNTATGVSTVRDMTNAFLDGTLEVRTIGPPLIGASFTPIVADTLTGTFAKVTYGDPPYQAVYSSTAASLISVRPPARFVPVNPARILDTRTGNGAPAVRLPASGTIHLTVAGRGGVPATGASAIALTVTGVDSSPGFVTVWPTGESRPTTSNLNTTRPGQTAAVQVIVPIGTDGKVSLYAYGGGDLLSDVAGWYQTSDAATSGRFNALAPSRLLDTRLGTGGATGRRGPGVSTAVAVAGHGGVPASGASAVVLSVTAVDSSPGWVTVWPTGQTRPTASNINTDFQGQTVAAHVMVPLGAGGSISLFTSGGGHLIVDVVGWFTDATAASGTHGLYVPLSPERQLDSRTGLGVTSAGRRQAKSTTGLILGGADGIPSTGVSGVVASVTAVQADPTFLTAWAGGSSRPLASNLNVTLPGDIVANLVTSPVGPAANANLYTEASTHLIVDTFGYYQS